MDEFPPSFVQVRRHYSFGGTSYYENITRMSFVRLKGHANVDVAKEPLEFMNRWNVLPSNIHISDGIERVDGSPARRSHPLKLVPPAMR